MWLLILFFVSSVGWLVGLVCSAGSRTWDLMNARQTYSTTDLHLHISKTYFKNNPIPYKPTKSPRRSWAHGITWSPRLRRLALSHALFTQSLTLHTVVHASVVPMQLKSPQKCRRREGTGHRCTYRQLICVMNG